ncbi:hypothetical protein [Streptomyces sp. NRRL S-118]|uniref:hypothetical protein n=1 Tax=Streptomyces sp. NRRL S-118 TaxID=1463881 RepID=UPI0004C915FA|nr:hypothetical protein [Streptomyces sp. NRRL S-118]
MNLRLIGIGAVVVFAAVLPLVASAGPAGSPDPGPDSVSAARPPAGPVPDSGSGPASGDPRSGTMPGSGAPRSGSPASGAAGAPAGAAASASGLLAGIDAPQGAARCGPELASPEGVEAQTCVLTEGPDAWARTYYRNATGAELTSVLTLMAPGGRTVRTHCTVPADDEPGACETPREPRRGKSAEYTAVAEFAESGDAETSPLLLRSGSNAPEPRAS